MSSDSDSALRREIALPCEGTDRDDASELTASSIAVDERIFMLSVTPLGAGVFVERMRW